MSELAQSKPDVSNHTETQNWEAIERCLKLATEAESLRERSRQLREASRLIREESIRTSREIIGCNDSLCRGE